MNCHRKFVSKKVEAGRFLWSYHLFVSTFHRKTRNVL